MNATHILRRAALLTSAVGLAGTALLAGGGTAYAAPGPDHDWDHNGRHQDRDATLFEPRHPRQARHWDDDLERCNPNSCWRGFGGHPRDGDGHEWEHGRRHHHDHDHDGGDDD